jgi:hypothetical protein
LARGERVHIAQAELHGLAIAGDDRISLLFDQRDERVEILITLEVPFAAEIGCTELEKVEGLPGIRQFEQQLTSIRAPAIETAQERNDRAAEARIRRLCGDAAELVRRYLDADKLRLAREEIEDLLKLAEEDKAAGVR